LGGPGAEDRRRDGRDREPHRGRARGLHLLDEQELLDRRFPEAAELLRPADAPPALREELLVERARERTVTLVAGFPHLGDQRRGHRLPQEGPHLVPPGELRRREVVSHQSRTTWRTRTISIRPVSPISRLMRNVKNDIRSQPPSADQKPCTVKPFTTSDAIHSIIAFTTSVKRPSVRMFSGSVRRRTNGRTTALKMPIAAAAKMSGTTP